MTTTATPTVLEPVDIFISHAGADHQWAEWVAYHLEAAGFSVVLDIRDWGSGDDFLHRMQLGLERADRMVALFSRPYFDGTYSMMELRSWLTQPDADLSLVVLRIEEVTPPVFYRRHIYRDLFGLAEDAAIAQLVDAVRPRPPADGPPPFPNDKRDRPVLPATLPPIWNVAPRNPAFTGRDELLARVRHTLQTGDRAVVQAINGLGGVGKTQLAIEYAHRFATAYDLVWWIDAEQAERVAEQLAKLATLLGVAPRETPIPEAAAAAKDYLRLHDRWLLIFDNAETRADVAPWLPGARGHVLITSRNQAWTGVADPVDVSVFSSAESVAFLQGHVEGLPEAVATEIATALDHLPLALAQAVGVLSSDSIPPETYLSYLGGHSAAMMAVGSGGYRPPLAASVALSMERLAAVDPAALELLRICSLLAPEPIPLDLFAQAPSGALPPALAEGAASPTGLDACVPSLTRMGLARAVRGGIVLHRLTQSIVEDTMRGGALTAARRSATAIIAEAYPDDGTFPRSWPRWEELMPHLLALDPGTSDNPTLRAMANDGVVYLLARGDTASARSLADNLHDSMRRALGPRHRDTLQAAQNLANCLFDAGQHDDARRMDERTLALRRDTFGEDDPDTLDSASDLALDLHALGDYPRARELNERTFAARRRLLGDEHPHTLTSANNLAHDLRALGLYEAARQLDEQTLEIRTAERGADDPITLITASNLALDLYQLREYEPAREIYERVLDVRSRVLPPNHPDTRESARALAHTLRALGRHEDAAEIDPKNARPAAVAPQNARRSS